MVAHSGQLFGLLSSTQIKSDLLVILISDNTPSKELDNSSPKIHFFESDVFIQCTRGFPVRLVLINAPIAPNLFIAKSDITKLGLFSMNKTTLSPCSMPSFESLFARIFAASLVCEYVHTSSSKYRKSLSPCSCTVS